MTRRTRQQEGEVLAAEMPGLTAAEQRRGESLDEHLGEELPNGETEEAVQRVAEAGPHTEWNVVVTLRGDDYRYAQEALRALGTVEPTSFYNVLLLHVDDAECFPDALAAAITADDRLAGAIGHAAPASIAFVFDTAEQFEARATAAALDLVDDLANTAFHVRMHRRGGPREMQAHGEEELLADVVTDALERAGTPARVTFEDPDAILEVQTVDGWAGVAVRTREDLRDFAFLRTG